MLPSQFKPKCPNDFVGPARVHALRLQRAVQDAKANGNAPMRILINGDPGVGKSALAGFFISQLACDAKWSVQKYNGTQVKIEKAEEIAQSLCYKDIFGNYRVVWIEEADTIPQVAQVRFLTLSDDLPSGVAIICTSNCTLAEFVKRFQSRFKVYEVEAPQPHEISGLLRRFISHEPTITAIAASCNGDVRAALNDAENFLQMPAEAAA
jgi:replication-associated recombination protein RarA